MQPVVYPGKCWQFAGSKGAVILKLPKKIKVTGMTVKHVSKKQLNGIITSAPKHVILSVSIL